MDSNDLKITITGVNNASKVFDAVVDSARKLGPELDKATDGAKRLKPAAQEAVKAVDPLSDELDEAGRAATESGKAIEQSAKSMGDMKTAARDTVAGLALMGTAFTMYAGQAREHEMTIMAVRRMYGEAADSYIAFADTIQNTTIFSNDEALAAARIMGTLRENYDLTDQQIKQLIQTSADLATMHGFTLSDAAQRVSAAIRGEAESAEMLGLTMNQAAIDSQNLTLSMTNQEAAAFRYDALMKQAASSTGAAGDAADTTAGKTQQLANRTQDAMMSFVEFTGPIGQAASSLGSFGVEAAIAAGGIGQISKGLIGLKGAGGIAALATSLAGPAGIAVAAGVAGYALWQLFSDVEDAGVVAFEKATQATGDLDASIQALVSTIDDARVGLNLLGDAEEFKGLTAEIERQLELFAKWGDPSNWNNGVPLNFVDNGNPADLAAARAEWEELIALNARLGDSTQTMAAQVAASYEQIIQNSGLGSEAALQTAMNWVDAFQAGEITLVELNDRLNGVIADFPNYAKAALEVQAAQQELTTATNNTRTAFSEQAAQADILTDALLAQESAAAQLLKTQTLAADRAIDRQRANLWSGSEPTASEVVGVNDPRTMRSVTMGLDAIGEAALASAFGLETAAEAHDRHVASVLSLVPAADTFTHKYFEMGAAVEQSSRSMTASLEELNADYVALAESVVAALGALDPNAVLGGGFNAIVGGAKGFATLSQSVADWSNELAGGNKAMNVLIDLNSKGLISNKTFRDAIEANHRIQQANNDVQEDSLRIQAKQLPIMADMAEAQAAYVDEIADMPAAQQAAVLGYMDQAKTAQALELAQLAAASSTTAMQQSTTDMIAAVAAGDPVLKAMLIDMGLISEGADGTITVNFGDVDSSVAAMTALNDTLTTLNQIIAEAFGIVINVEDNATGPLAGVLGMLAALDGRTVTTYIKTVESNTRLYDQVSGNMHGGVIGKYASGGVVAEMGEAGPELFRVPNGGWGVAATHSLYNVPPGTSVLPAPATRDILDKARGGRGGPTYNGPVYQTITYQESSFARRQHNLASSRR
jgi:hypothetical protein